MLRQRLDESDPVLVKRVDDYYDGRIGMPRLGSEYDYSAAFELVIPDQAARQHFLEQLFEGACWFRAQVLWSRVIVTLSSRRTLIH